MDDSAEVFWSLDDGPFALCENGTTNPDAAVGCGEYGVGKAGDYTIRVVWNEVTVDKGIMIEKDRDYQANADLAFGASEFVP